MVRLRNSEVSVTAGILRWDANGVASALVRVRTSVWTTATLQWCSVGDSVVASVRRSELGPDNLLKVRSEKAPLLWPYV
jgi:hypothetical protein